MKSLTLRASTILFLLTTLGSSAASAAPMNLTGSTAVAAVVAQYSPLLSAYEKKFLTGLFDGNTKISYPKKKLSISAETVMCKIGNVDITAPRLRDHLQKGQALAERPRSQ
jgi:hypothetical protein